IIVMVKIAKRDPKTYLVDRGGKTNTVSQLEYVQQYLKISRQEVQRTVAPSATDLPPACLHNRFLLNLSLNCEKDQQATATYNP
ncbi:hypothetical protein CU097_000573, partial [Rhizopus azygosporus]